MQSAVRAHTESAPVHDTIAWPQVVASPVDRARSPRRMPPPNRRMTPQSMRVASAQVSARRGWPSWPGPAGRANRAQPAIRPTTSSVTCPPIQVVTAASGARISRRPGTSQPTMAAPRAATTDFSARLHGARATAAAPVQASG